MTVEPTGAKYLHLDHLGTPRRITNGSRAVIASHDYYPFGEEITASAQDAEALKFTGHERDLRDLTKTTDDLDYMHARHYNPWIARFLSTDPIGGTPGSPQSWNRYSYVLGNPVNRVDPNGLSSLLFNGATNTLTLFDRDGSVIGSWTAHNNVQLSNTNEKWEDGTYEMFDTNSPHMHPGVADADTADGSFGEHGIFRAKPFTESNGNERVGMGVHSGRESKKDKHKPGRSGTEHATDGCVRTTGAAMANIAATAETDPLTTITVTDNKSPLPKDTPTHPDDPEEEKPQ